MFRAVFLCLPMHPGGPGVVNLHPVHAHVALPGLRVLREHQRKRDESTAILRPALQYRKIQQVDVASLPHNLLARPILHALWEKRSQFRQLWQHLQLVEQALRRLHVHEPANPRRHVIQLIYLESQFHPPLASKRVDQQLIPRPLRFLKQQCHPARISLRSRLRLRPLHNFHDFQHRIDFRLHALQLALFFQPAHKLPQILVSHFAPPRVIERHGPKRYFVPATLVHG